MNRAWLLACTVAVTIPAWVPAQAGNFDIKLGGDALFEVGVVSQNNDTNLKSYEVRDRFRFRVIPTAKADNGLEYGAYVRFRAASATRTIDIDRSYMFMQGGFGEIRLGVTPGFDGEISHLINGAGRPIAYLPFGLYDQAAGYIGPTGAAQGTDARTGRYIGSDFRGGVAGALQAPATLMWAWMNADGGASKILYASPRMAGLQVGGSFTPRNDSSNTDVNRSKIASTSGAQFTGIFQDIYEIGANYKIDLGPVKATTSLAYMGGSASASSNAVDSFKDLGGYVGTLRFDYGGFSIGGDYMQYGKSGQNARFAYRDNAWTWQVGTQYKIDAYILGAAFIHTEDPGQVDRPGKRTANVYEVGAGYTVAPGLVVQLQYDYFDTKSDKAVTLVTGSPNDKAHVFEARTMVAF